MLLKQPCHQAIYPLNCVPKANDRVFAEGTIMKKKLALLIIFVLIAGCTSPLDRVRKNNRKRLLKLSVGMTKVQALKVMGTSGGGGLFGEPTVKSPYKSQTLQNNERSFEILYYYTDINSRIHISHPGTIRDKDLTPLVFENNILVGWGNTFLKTLTPD